MAPEISVVITTHNRRELLLKLLESLGMQTLPAQAYEVVVVVDGSTDGTGEALAALEPPYSLAVLEQLQGGQSAARNAGVARASAPVLLFVDDDEVADPNLVAAHLELHRTRRRVAGVGVIERRVPGNADRLAQMLAEDAVAQTDQLATKQLTYLDAYGGNSSVTREVFDEVGGYAVDLPRETDFEFGYRLHAAGVAFVYLRDAIVAEYRTRSWRGILRDFERRGGISIELYRRHPPIIETMELGGYGFRTRSWVAARTALLGVRVPARLVALPGFVLPRRRARAWFRFALDYSYWRGVRSAADAELWRRSRRGTAILRYHAFAAEGERPTRYVVSARGLDRQLRWLARRGYTVLSLAEYLDYRASYRFPPAKSVVITIDDGYVDNDTIARPVLEKHGAPATIFLITGSNGRHPHASDPALVDRPVFELEQAVRLTNGTIDLGAHTRTHPELTTLEAATAGDEIAGSKRDLETALGRPVATFAYPNGAVDDDVRCAVEGAGFDAAVGTKPGHNRPATDRFDLRRLEVRGTDSLLRFATMLVFGEIRLNR
jgi:peptidoglycan/xylan/chitin deacetylase (PgdA/CDA1 family)/GT2 family glycosyltransferase